MKTEFKWLIEAPKTNPNNPTISYFHESGLPGLFTMSRYEAMSFATRDLAITYITNHPHMGRHDGYVYRRGDSDANTSTRGPIHWALTP